MWLAPKNDIAFGERTAVPDAVDRALTRLAFAEYELGDWQAAKVLAGLVASNDHIVLCGCRGVTANPPQIGELQVAGREKLNFGHYGYSGDDLPPMWHSQHCCFFRDEIAHKFCLADGRNSRYGETIENIPEPEIFISGDCHAGDGKAPIAFKQALSWLRNVADIMARRSMSGIINLAQPVLQSGHDLKLENWRWKQAAMAVSLPSGDPLEDFMKFGRDVPLLSHQPASEPNRFRFHVMTSADVTGPIIKDTIGQVRYRAMCFEEGAKRAGGPFLVTGLLAPEGDGQRFDGIVALAIPILFQNRFFPVRHAGERRLLRNLHAEWMRRSRPGVLFAARPGMAPLRFTDRKAADLEIILSDHGVRRSVTLQWEPPCSASLEPTSIEKSGPSSTNALMKIRLNALGEPSMANAIIDRLGC